MSSRMNGLSRVLVSTVSVLATACFALDEFSDRPEAVGAIGFNLTLPADMPSADLDYTIVGKGDYQKTGKIPAGLDARTFIATINNIPVGTGYKLELAAGADASKIRCQGSAAFNITPQETTRVGVNVQCRITKDRASVLDPDPVRDAGTDGEVDDPIPADSDDDNNQCPDVDGLYTWREANGGFELSSSACDPDSSPAPLRYKWSVSAGKLSSTDDEVVRFVGPDDGGPVQVTLEVSDSLCKVVKIAEIDCDRRRDKQKP